jgi:hypothetical protein
MLLAPALDEVTVMFTGFTSGIHDLIIMVIIIVVLSGTGLLPAVVRGLREFRGERVDPPPASPPTTRDQDLSYKMLGLSPSASWDEVERAYRQKAKIHHPDHGGDEDTMRALNDAYRMIKRSRGKA